MAQLMDAATGADNEGSATPPSRGTPGNHSRHRRQREHIVAGSDSDIDTPEVLAMMKLFHTTSHVSTGSIAWGMLGRLAVSYLVLSRYPQESALP